MSLTIGAVLVHESWRLTLINSLAPFAHVEGSNYPPVQRCQIPRFGISVNLVMLVLRWRATFCALCESVGGTVKLWRNFAINSQ